MGRWTAPRPGRFTTGAHCTGGWVGVVACLDGMGAENLAPTGVRTPERPSRNVSLYRLSCLGSYTVQAVNVASIFKAFEFAEFEKRVNIKHYRVKGR